MPSTSCSGDIRSPDPIQYHTLPYVVREATSPTSIPHAPKDRMPMLVSMLRDAYRLESIPDKYGSWTCLALYADVPLSSAGSFSELHPGLLVV